MISLRLCFAALIALSASVACGPPAARATPGVSAETFDGPGDALSAAERNAFREAANAIIPKVEKCIDEGYAFGVHSSDVVARIRFRRDGHIYAVGFKANPTDDSVTAFLSCMRAAIASMDLKKTPWEADHNVVYRFTTTVKTTWD